MLDSLSRSRNLSYDRIYQCLESRLDLYTGLWFASLTDAASNLIYTAVLAEIFRSKALLDIVSSPSWK